MDSIIAVHETIHSLKQTRQLGMLIKLDIEKAYDKLSCQFLERMLEAYGFSEAWVGWVMALVTSPFFSIFLNVSPMQVFAPSHGIRHGDPLSPFLFFLMAKGMSRFIQSQVSEGGI